MVRSDQLPQVFADYLRGLISSGAIEAADWRIQESADWVDVVIPKTDTDGFDLIVWADQEEVTVHSEYLAHQHFTSDGDHLKVSEHAMALVRDLLSPAMRLRVLWIGRRPAKASFESFRSGIWQRECTTALFVLPWFRSRKELIYVNTRLTARDYA